jgi:hypothetical protein
MRALPTVILSLLVPAAAIAGEAVAESKPLPPVAPQPVETRPDPTAAVVAEGRYLYRQRDLDALMAIALRHAKGKVGKADEERLRQTLLMAMTAREPLLQVLGNLPPSYPARGREALLLDLLDYQAEPAKPPVAPPAAAPTAGTPAPAAPAGAAPEAAPAGPILVRLPPLTVTRSLEAAGKRSLTIGLALVFTDPALSKTMEAKAPLIQDAILGYAHALTPAQIAEPDQVALKAGFAKAIAAKVPGFPLDGVLIPQLDAGDGPAAAER